MFFDPSNVHNHEMVQPLPWSESFVVGHAGLDAEHLRLVELINDVIAAVYFKTNLDPELLPGLLKVLGDVVVEHIRNENAILWEMQSGSYVARQGHPPTPYLLKAIVEAAFDEHMAEHETLLARFDEVRALPLDTVCEALKSWFLDHAVKHDSRLKAIFRAI